MVEQLHEEGRLCITPASRAPERAEDWETWGAARDGARTVLTGVQAAVLVALVGVIGSSLALAPREGLIGLIAVVTVIYFATGLHKIWLFIRGERVISLAAAEPELPSQDTLPTYTILVPLFREDRILPTLVDHLRRLDYPADRLDVLLLIESDDERTKQAVSRCPLPPHVRPELVPPGRPRTKPRALNVGLRAAVGEFVVVYDAEDRPEPDQLRKAVATMRRLPQNVACLQARLNFYNLSQSFLTRLGAVDYAAWYNQMLPGLTSGRARSGGFVPLGGTSNHFRVAALRAVGGWDPFNVTEDCDLGVRLGRNGYRVAMLASTTWEEAVPRAKPWIRQHSRWNKGYLQTYLVHMRQPVGLLYELGPRSFVNFQMLVGFNSLLLLLNPVMWGMTAAYIASKGTRVGAFIESLYPAPLYYLALLSLVAWNFIFFYSNAYVCVRHDYLRLTRYTLLTPVYWVLLSVGAWTGLASLVRRPFYWAKTEHGMSLPKAAPALPEASFPVTDLSGRQVEPSAQGVA